MADILAFPVKPNVQSAPRSKRRVKAAEIVIFPGIRYERWEEPPQVAADRSERDLLRLVD